MSIVSTRLSGDEGQSAIGVSPASTKTPPYDGAVFLGKELSLSKQLVCMGCGWKVERMLVDMHRDQVERRGE